MDGVLLAHRRVGRDHDVGGDPAELRRQRHRHAVVAGGLRDDTFRCRRVAQAEDRIGRAADLEGAGLLEALALEVQGVPGVGVDGGRAVHGRAVDVRRDAGGGAAHRRQVDGDRRCGVAAGGVGARSGGGHPQPAASSRQHDHTSAQAARARGRCKLAAGAASWRLASLSKFDRILRTLSSSNHNDIAHTLKADVAYV